MKGKLKKVGMMLAVSTFVLGGVCLVNADSQAENAFGELAKGSTYSFTKVYSYPKHQGAVKPTKEPANNLSVTWSYGRRSGNNYPSVHSEVLGSLVQNQTKWAQGYRGGTGDARNSFTANNATFYGNIQTLNATD